MQSLHGIAMCVVISSLAVGGCRAEASLVCVDDECQPDAGPRDSCTEDADCPINHSCAEGVCQKAAFQCTDDAQCAPDQHCVDGACFSRIRKDIDVGMAEQDATAAPPQDLELCEVEYDWEADGLFDRRDIFIYDEAGLLAREERRSAGSSQNRAFVYHYDESGNLVQVDTDQDLDETIDSRETYQYDEAGNLIQVERDSDMDGAPNRRTTYTYDAENRLTAERRDSGADGTVESMRRYNYGASGLLREFTVDLGDDGDVEQRHVFEYDDEGRVVRYDYDSPADGEIDRRATYVYEEPGLVARESDRDADGTVERTYVFTYDEQPLRFSISFLSELRPDRYQELPEYRPKNRPTGWEVFDETMEVTTRGELIYNEVERGVEAVRRHDFDVDGTIDYETVFRFALPADCER